MDTELLTEFAEESLESLTALNNMLLDLEESHDKQEHTKLIGDIFRILHTIKGSAGFLNFKAISTIAHNAESLLDQIREGKKDCDSDLITTILKASALLETLIKSAKNNAAEPDPLPADFKKIDTELKTACAQPPLKTPPTTTAEEKDKEEQTTKTPPTTTEEKDKEGQKPSSFHSTTGEQKSVRVSLQLLERLMNLTGELVLSRNSMLEKKSLEGQCLQQMSSVISELQETILKTRMQPIENAWNTLPGLVRQISKSFNKFAKITMEGGHIEVDRQVLQAIKDPLVHCVRNALDHGIETPQERKALGKSQTGSLTLKARQESGYIAISLQDDGCGVCPERLREKLLNEELVSSEELKQLSYEKQLQYLFAPGFSTAQHLSSVSGRGVGLDVVKTNVEGVGGAVTLQSTPQQGSCMEIVIPITLAITSAMIVSCGDIKVVLPKFSISEVVRLGSGKTKASLKTLHHTPLLSLREQLIPLLSLQDILGLTDRKEMFVVLLTYGRHLFGLLVESIVTTEEIVAKPLVPPLRSLDIYSGSTLLGDGSVAMILDPNTLAKRVGHLSALKKEASSSLRQTSEDPQMVIFRLPEDDKLYALPLESVKRIEDLTALDLMKSHHGWVLRYQDTILPLYCWPLEKTETILKLQHRNQRIVILCHKDIQSALIIEDILEMSPIPPIQSSASPKPGLLGHAVLKGKILSILDPAFLTSLNSP